MEQNSKKSQVAMESLMVYGIAILIVMLAVGALIYFGVLDLGAYLPDSCKIKGGSFECVDFAIDATGGGINIDIKNRVGKTITDLESCSWISEGDRSGTLQPDRSEVANGNTVLLTDGESGEDFEELVGKKTKLTFTCQYKISGSSIQRTFNGELTTTVSGSY
ncbi:hypothetical protein JXB41_08270 [Candidatus Woesearchaeota archaeon]|nr:hypothetical protein [Candidatus Woesearchaeota archaeon]